MTFFLLLLTDFWGKTWRVSDSGTLADDVAGHLMRCRGPARLETDRD